MKMISTVNVGKEKSYPPLVGVLACASTMDITTEVSEEAKNKTII